MKYTVILIYFFTLIFVFSHTAAFAGTTENRKKETCPRHDQGTEKGKKNVQEKKEIIEKLELLENLDLFMNSDPDMLKNLDLFLADS